MDKTAASETVPVDVISFEASFHSYSGMASFSRTSTEAWWMERPMTWTCRPRDASSRRCSFVNFFRLLFTSTS